LHTQPGCAALAPRLALSALSRPRKQVRVRASPHQSNALCERWLRQGDFLLLPLEPNFTHVIGNPPYVRQELIPDVLMAEYRRRFETI
jgi:hypothetical protein